MSDERPVKYKKYTRKQVHDIFDPNSNFSKGAGIWGLQGIIEEPSCNGNYVFFVTIGSEFEEGITENGILIWQTQQSMNFSTEKVNDFIMHDEKINNIYLFLRVNSSSAYSYLGKLAYYTHDNEREYPVYFMWKIIDFNNKKTQQSLGKFSFVPEIDFNYKLITNRKGITTKKFDKMLNTANLKCFKKSYIERQIKKFVHEIKEYEKEEEKLENVRKKFVNDYKIKNIQQMKKEDYVVGFNNNSFCNRLENELKELGDIHGGSSFKFGLYYGKNGKDEKKKYRIAKTKYGEDPEEAWESIKKQLAYLIIDGENENIEGIKNCSFGPVLKGKILSTYYPEKYLCIFSDEHLSYCLKRLGIEYSKNDKEINKQMLLIKWKNEHQITINWNLYIFSRFLYETFGRPNDIKEDAQNQSEDDKLVGELGKEIIIKTGYTSINNGKPIPKRDPVLVNGTKVYPRDRKIAQNALSNANFKCEFNNEHPTFIKRNSNVNYTEPHHLVPMVFLMYH